MLIIALFVFGALAVAGVLFYELTRSPIEIKRRQDAAVLENSITGTYRAYYRNGTYYYWFWWRLTEEKIDLTRQPLTHREENLALIGSNLVTIEVRGNWVIGRRRQKTGDHIGQLDLTNPDPAHSGGMLQIDDVDTIDGDEVVRTVVNLEKAIRLSEVIGRLQAALATVLSGFDVDDILDVGVLGKPHVKIDIPQHVKLDSGQLKLAWLRAQSVTDKDDLYLKLGQALEYILNFEFRNLGIAVANMKVMKIILNPKVQQAREDMKKNILAREAAEAKRTGHENDLTFREAIAPDEDYADVTKAQALREVGESTRKGLEAIADGLKNFGKGP